MPRRLRSNRGISAQQSHQALAVLLHDGKVRASEVWEALRRRERLLNELKGRLAALGEGMMRVAAKKDGSSSMTGMFRASKGQASRKPREPISAARRASMRSQGRYLAAVRPLSKSARMRVRAIRQKSGMRAAIAAARKMAK